MSKVDTEIQYAAGTTLKVPIIIGHALVDLSSLKTGTYDQLAMFNSDGINTPNVSEETIKQSALLFNQVYTSQVEGGTYSDRICMSAQSFSKKNRDDSAPVPLILTQPQTDIKVYAVYLRPYSSEYRGFQRLIKSVTFSVYIDNRRKADITVHEPPFEVLSTGYKDSIIDVIITFNTCESDIPNFINLQYLLSFKHSSARHVHIPLNAERRYAPGCIDHCMTFTASVHERRDVLTFNSVEESLFNQLHSTQLPSKQPDLTNDSAPDLSPILTTLINTQCTDSAPSIIREVEVGQAAHLSAISTKIDHDNLSLSQDIAAMVRELVENWSEIHNQMHRLYRDKRPR